jgi:triacylglycerol lipase
MRFSTTLAALLGIITGCAGLASEDQGLPIEDGEDDVVNAPPPGPLTPGKAAVVLAHGFGGSADSWDPAIQTAIQADGHSVLYADVPPTDGVKSRASALGPQIDAFLASSGATQVHIIAHSMGGLDSRYLISSMGYASKVASLTTISTPHKGTPLADVALGLQDGDQGAALDALVGLAELVGLVDREQLDEALIDLSQANAPVFAAANPDAAGVLYQSYAGFATPGGISNANAEAMCGGNAPDTLRPLLLIPAVVVANGTDRLPNDGIVGIDSAMHTGFLGCIPADHLDEAGTPGIQEPTLDVPAFYKSIVNKLVP